MTPNKSNTEKSIHIQADVWQFPLKNAVPPPKSTKSRNLNCWVQIQIIFKSQFSLLLQDTEESEFLDSVDFGM